MMELALLFITIFFITFSGALMPGPVLFVTIRHAAAGGRWAGPLVVVGHALVEVPLMLAVILGLDALLKRDLFVGAVGLAGGLVLFLMSGAMLRSLPRLKLPAATDAAGLAAPHPARVVGAGAVTSVSNPYFFIWWATVGLKLLADAAPFAVLGYAVFYVGHILSDLVWYSAVSESVYRGRRLLSDRAYRWLVGVLAVAMAGFAVWFGSDGLARLLQGHA